MQTYPIEVEAHPTPHDGQFLADQLHTYNVEQTGYDDGKYLTLWVKSPTGSGWQDSMAGPGAAVVTSRTSGCTKPSEDRAMVRSCYMQRNRKPAPVVATKSSSTRIAFRHQGSIRSTGMKCSRCWRIIHAATATIICGSA